MLSKRLFDDTLMHLFSEKMLFWREMKPGIFKSVCLDKVVCSIHNAYIILHHIGIILSIRCL